MSTSPRAKRDPEGRKRAIVAATVELIAELGVHGVNHRRIAERAGVPLGATTQYFSSRGDLIRAALHQMEADYERDLERLDGRLAAAEDPVAMVADFFLQYLGDADEARAALAFFLAVLHTPELTEASDRWQRRQAEVLARHVGPRFAGAAATYAYGLYLQASAATEASPAPSRDTVLWTLRLLATEERV